MSIKIPVPLQVFQERNIHSENSQDCSSHPFRFSHCNHDATTAADPSQINNVEHGVGMLVVTILIVVAAAVILALLLVLFIISACRKRRISDRMAREERGVTGSDYPTSPAALFLPQYSLKSSKSLLSRILERLRLKKLALPSKTQITVKKGVLERWDAHARSPSDGIQCTRNENDVDGYSNFSTGEMRSPMSLPFNGLSSAQNLAISSTPHSSEAPVPLYFSNNDLSGGYSRAAAAAPANKIKRPDKALLVMGASPTEAYPDNNNDTRERLGVGSQYTIRRKNNEAPSRVSVSTSVSSGTRPSFGSAPAYPDRTLGRTSSAKGATGHSSFTSSGTIPKFNVPYDTDGDCSLRVVGTPEKSFSTSPTSGKRFDATLTSGTSAQYAHSIHADHNALQLPPLPSWGLTQTRDAPLRSFNVTR